MAGTGTNKDACTARPSMVYAVGLQADQLEIPAGKDVTAVELDVIHERSLVDAKNGFPVLGELHVSLVLRIYVFVVTVANA